MVFEEDPHGECRHEIHTLQAEVAELKANLAPFEPMSIEDAEKAYDEAVAMPLSDGEIGNAVKFATDPEYRAEVSYKNYKRQFQISRGFKHRIAEIEAERDWAQLLARAVLGCSISTYEAADQTIAIWTAKQMIWAAWDDMGELDDVTGLPVESARGICLEWPQIINWQSVRNARRIRCRNQSLIGAMPIMLFDKSIESGATFSDCRRYRYSLWRIWDAALDPLIVCGLNPSTADENVNDPTIRRCIDFAKRWNYGGLVMLNLFAFRATDPDVMLLEPEPVGPENDATIRAEIAKGGMLLAAWGDSGGAKGRARGVKVMELIRASKRTAHCLGTTLGHGSPRHPLFVPGDFQPVEYLPAVVGRSPLEKAKDA